MSYIKADEILPKELLETIQQYAGGMLIYVPCKEKQEWGSRTTSRLFFSERNTRIFEAWKNGASVNDLSRLYSLSEKSIQRILRIQKLASAMGE